MESFSLSPMTQPAVVFCEWTRPVLNAAVTHVLKGQTKGTADLRDWLLLLPTRQAGRRLREALAWEMHKRRGALFPPTTATPWHLVRPAENAAPELACLWHWEYTLTNADLRKFKNLFPHPPAQADATWRRQMARMFHELRGTLAEGGLDFTAVAESGHCPEETARWRDLKKLEAAYRKSLGAQVDLHDAKRAAAENPVLPEGIRRVTVMGVPDFPAQVQLALQNLQVNGTPMEVIIFGPEGGEDLFDDWGRPVPESWTQRELTIANDQLFTQLNEAAQATEVASRLAAYTENRPAHVAVGVVDPAITPRLERTLADMDIAFYNPHGRSLRHAPMFIFLRALQAILHQPTFAHAEALLRLPDAWGWARGVIKEFSPTVLLKGLDELRQNQLPASLADAANFYFADEDYHGPRIPARDILKALETELARITNAAPAEGLVSFLKAVFEGQQFTEGREEDTVNLETAHQFMDLVAEWEAILNNGSGLPIAEALGLLLDLIGQEAVHPERPEDAVDIQGWLELAWEDAPHLIVAGANEGLLPETIHGDCFLPEALRERLGLRTNGDRFARDVWLLELLLQSRIEGGHVDILLGQQRTNGDPLKPSRLLFRCSDELLPSRVERLFEEPPPKAQPPAWSSAWRLRVGEIQPIEKVGVTALGNYLSCPYRFYLRHILKMEAPNLELREMNARGFGSLVHDVLDEFGKDKKAGKLKDSEAIQQFFISALNRQVKKKYGKRPPLPLRVQVMAAKRRLYQAAIEQARSRAEGWKIIRTEDTFKKKLDDLLISGRIDCVEENKKSGAVRVLDFKSSHTAKKPAEMHWKRTPRTYDEETIRPYARFEINGREHRWTNLQLPLYAWAVEEKFESELTLGYFNLPAIGTDTGITLLEPFNHEIYEAALKCARGVVADLKAQRFWPPTPRVDHDDFENILFGQPELTSAPPGKVAA